MTGLKRYRYAKNNRVLTMLPVALITGVRQGGMTALERMRRPGWQPYDLENPENGRWSLTPSRGNTRGSDVESFCWVPWINMENNNGPMA